ncbi:MAG: aldose epimerase family protein [Candidatus Cryptobacteroides sp.]|jgi:aldose 1-epimerase
MKKSLAILLTALCSAFCSRQPESPALIDASRFDSELDGQVVGLYTIRGGGLTLQATNFGGRVVSLFVPDNTGTLVDVVLGHPTLEEYVNYAQERFLGAVVGPVANRITNASFTVDGQTYKLSANHGGKGTLHGGFKGLDSVVWDVKALTDSSLTLHYLHADGQEGFPGNLDIEMTYTLTHVGGWSIDYVATTDKTRPVNISNHPYFNLSGGKGTCEDYEMYVDAFAIIGIDGLDVIEDPIDIKGTAFDYLTPHPVKDALGSDDEQIRRGRGFDHNYCINWTPGQTALVASLYNPANGIFLEVFSDQPGLQVYSGQYFTGEEDGKYDQKLAYRGSFTFETQNWPDAPNKASFPDCYLKPGEKYSHHCEYRFSIK